MLCLSPIIRTYECGSLLLSLIFEKYLAVYYNCKEATEVIVAEKKLEFLNMELLLIENKFSLMKNAFLKDSELYHSNLIHGFLLALSKMIDSI